MRRLWRKLKAVRRRDEMARELDEEIRFHLEMMESDGTGRAEFGNVALVCEASRESWGWPTLEGWLRDLRLALRSLRRTPVASAAVVVSLGVGIGAALAVYSIADAIFLRRLKVPDEGSLVSIYQRSDDRRAVFSSHAWPHYEALRDQAGSFESLAAYSRIPVNVRLGGTTERLITELVSNNYFQMLRVQPLVGRAFRPDDGQVAILGERLWRERFGSDPEILGNTLILNAQAFTVIGVLPGSFHGVVLDWGKPPELWIPASARAVFPALPFASAGSHWMLVTGRLRLGATMEQAQSEAETVSQRFYEQDPMNGQKFRPLVMPVQMARFWPAHRASLENYVALLAAVGGLTLLMACFNVANLLLGRAARRQREFGIQVAMGAGRARLARTLLLESGLLACGGAAAGLVMASLMTSALSRFEAPFGLPLNLDLSLNARVAGFAALAGVVTALLAALAPLRYAWRGDVLELMAGGMRAGGGRRPRLAEVLVSGQVAICLVALSGASLLERTLKRIQASDPMFHAGHALMAEVDLLSRGYDEAHGQRMLREMLRRVRELPGVQEAAYVKTVPLGGFRGARDVTVDGTRVNVQVNTVSPRYFAVAGLPLRQGRDLRDGETSAVVVNEQLAERFWPGRSALGRIIALPQTKQQFMVAGEVRDGRMRTFREAEIAPCVYLPLEADYQRMITLYVRTGPPPEALRASLRTAFHEVDRDLPFVSGTLEKHLDRALARERLAASSLSGLGAFTALLAAVGLYGLIALTVSRRAREIGIRMALGARPAGVVLEVLKRFTWLMSGGVAVGLAACAALSRFAQALVFGVRANDPTAFLTACGLVVFVAAMAAAAPAWRAAKTDPWQVLRQD